MAYVNVSTSELITLIDKNAKYNRDRIKSIKVTNDIQIEITVGVAAFLPDIKVSLRYNKFENGRMYFNIISNGGAKILLTLVSEMAKKGNKYLTLDKSSIVLEVDKVLFDNLKGMKVKEISTSGEQIYFTLSIS
jgi:citrate lyase alpha subunit